MFSGGTKKAFVNAVKPLFAKISTEQVSAINRNLMLPFEFGSIITEREEIAPAFCVWERSKDSSVFSASYLISMYDGKLFSERFSSAR